jgi:hypothetical protein
VVNKTLSQSDLERRSIRRKMQGAELIEDQDGGSKESKYTSTVPYTFFIAKHPNLNNYTHES